MGFLYSLWSSGVAVCKGLVPALDFLDGQFVKKIRLKFVEKSKISRNKITVVGKYSPLGLFLSAILYAVLLYFLG